MNLGPDAPVVSWKASLRARREPLQHLCPLFPARSSLRSGGNLLRPLRRDHHLRPARQGFPAGRGGVGAGPQVPAQSPGYPCRSWSSRSSRRGRHSPGKAAAGCSGAASQAASRCTSSRGMILRDKFERCRV